MRSRLALGFVLVLLAPLARAAKPVTIAQLDQILLADRGQSDPRIAGELRGLTLTERATAARLAAWQAQFAGPRTQQGLLLLADESAFQPLPAADLSLDPPPGLPAEGKIVAEALVYAGRTIRNLPNLFATRQTLHFEAEPDQVMEQSENANAPANFAFGILSLGKPSLSMEALNFLPLYLTKKLSARVTYRDGGEVRSDQVPSNIGLTTSGEFGPILSVVLDDAMHSSIVWGYWQPHGDARLAVFRYQVPAEKSHYQVAFRSGRDVVRSSPAYHGEIAVDPATGVIFRISILSEADPPFQRVGTGILVSYGPVVLGGRTYICPLHGVALSKTPILRDLGSAPGAPTPVQVHLNDVTFTRYHLFHADVRILTPDEEQRLHDKPPPATTPPQ